jgi:hypothetical protein
VEALVDYIYMTLCLDLDYIIPFAAVPENGREIDGLDDKSELAHCKVDLAAALEFNDFRVGSTSLLRWPSTSTRFRNSDAVDILFRTRLISITTSPPTPTHHQEYIQQHFKCMAL